MPLPSASQSAVQDSSLNPPRVPCSQRTTPSTEASTEDSSSESPSDDPFAPSEPERVGWGWTPYTHMNGDIYYTYDSHRLMTRENIRNRNMEEAILDVYYEFAFGEHVENIPDLEMIVASLQDDETVRESDLVAEFASWSQGKMYSLDNDGDLDDYQLSEKNVSSFWDHMWYFPMHRTHLPSFAENKFLTLLSFGSSQHVLGLPNAASSPLNDTQINRLLGIYRDLRGNAGSTIAQHALPALCFHIGWTISELQRSKLKNSKPAPWKLSLRAGDVILGILLCGAHTNYRTRLISTWVTPVEHGGVHLAAFRRLMKDLLAEWADSNLVATVLVSVDIGFLALPEVNPVAQSCAFLSSLLAMMSIAIGLHHVWKHRNKTTIEIYEAKKYLDHGRRRDSDREQRTTYTTARDMTPTAAFLALPIAALQWSALCFTLGVIVYALQWTSVLGALGAVVLVTLTGGVSVYFHAIWVSDRKSGERGRESIGLQVVWRRVRVLRRIWFAIWKKDHSVDADGDIEMAARRQ